MIQDNAQAIARLENMVSNKKKLFFQNCIVFLICGIFYGFSMSSRETSSWRGSWQSAVCYGIPWGLATGFLFTLWGIHSIRVKIDHLKEGKSNLTDYFRPTKGQLWKSLGQVVAIFVAQVCLQFLLCFVLLRH
jgi:hypothetical protein